MPYEPAEQVTGSGDRPTGGIAGRCRGVDVEAWPAPSVRNTASRGQVGKDPTVIGGALAFGGRDVGGVRLGTVAAQAWSPSELAPAASASEAGSAGDAPLPVMEQAVSKVVPRRRP
ncbi:MAG: hypothetical protein R2715_06020 [Ilumatobacteraceae bacterium]